MEKPRSTRAHHGGGTFALQTGFAPSHHYRSWRLKFSQLHVAIASSLPCVASDVLSPAAEECTAESTLFYTHAKGRTGPDYTHTHTHNICDFTQLGGSSFSCSVEALQSMRLCFHLNLKLVSCTFCGNFTDQTYMHTKIHCVNCHVMASSERGTNPNLSGHPLNYMRCRKKRAF